MAEKDAIVEDAKVEAEQIVEKAREEVEELEEEKDYLINGNGKDSAYDMPFEDWSIGVCQVKCVNSFYTSFRNLVRYRVLTEIPVMVETCL